MTSYLRFEVVRTLRNVRYLMFLVVMPVVFSLIWAGEGDGAMVAMTVYAACGGALLGSGNTIAEDRFTGWLRQLRVTPLPDRAWLAGKIAQGVLTVVPGVVLVCVVAAATGHVELSPGRWLALLAVMFIGSLPFALVGTLVGLLFRGKTATVGLMLAFFALMFLGGVIGGETMWIWAPTDSLLTAGLHAVDGRPPGLRSVLNLALWAVVAGVGVLLRWRRA